MQKQWPVFCSYPVHQIINTLRNILSSHHHHYFASADKRNVWHVRLDRDPAHSAHGFSQQVVSILFSGLALMTG